MKYANENIIIHKIFYGNEDNLKKAKNIEETINFKNDYVKARKWGEENWEKWTKKIKLQEKKAFSTYTYRSKELNAYLWKYSEPLKKKPDNMSEEEWKKCQEYNKIIDHLDHALNESKTNNTLIVYRRITEENLFTIFPEPPNELPESLKLRKNGRIDEELLNKILNSYIETEYQYKDYGFISTALSQDPTPTFADRPILLKIEVPKGSNVGYLSKELTNHPDQLEMLLPRGKYYKYQKARRIITNGKETLAIDMKLINEELKLVL